MICLFGFVFGTKQDPKVQKVPKHPSFDNIHITSKNCFADLLADWAMISNLPGNSVKSDGTHYYLQWNAVFCSLVHFDFVEQSFFFNSHHFLLVVWFALAPNTWKELGKMSY